MSVLDRFRLDDVTVPLYGERLYTTTKPDSPCSTDLLSGIGHRAAPGQYCAACSPRTGSGFVERPKPVQ